MKNISTLYTVLLSDSVTFTIYSQTTTTVMVIMIVLIIIDSTGHFSRRKKVY